MLNEKHHGCESDCPAPVYDDPARPPAELLADLIQRAALARNLDFLATDDTSLPILTVHQSKGLEFDTVIIAGLAATPSAPSATPRFASSHSQNPIVPAPRSFATFATLRFKSFPFRRSTFDVGRSMFYPLPSISFPHFSPSLQSPRS